MSIYIPLCFDRLCARGSLRWTAVHIHRRLCTPVNRNKGERGGKIEKVGEREIKLFLGVGSYFISQCLKCFFFSPHYLITIHQQMFGTLIATNYNDKDCITLSVLAGTNTLYQ